eukprot:gene4259-7595_t
MKQKQIRLHLFAPKNIVNQQNKTAEDGELSPKTPCEPPLFKTPKACPPTPKKSPSTLKKNNHARTSSITLFDEQNELNFSSDLESDTSFDEENLLNCSAQLEKTSISMPHKRKLDCLKSNMSNNLPLTPSPWKTKKLFDDFGSTSQLSSPGLDALPLATSFSEGALSPIFSNESPNDSIETPTDIRGSGSYFEDSDDEFVKTNDDLDFPSTPPRLTQTQSEPSSPKGLYPGRFSMNSKVHVNAFSPMRSAPKFNLPSKQPPPSPFEKPPKRRKSSELSSSQGDKFSQDSNVIDVYFSRYITDFKEVKVLGSGSFGEVSKCTYRIDGIDYAIKKTTRMIYNEKYEEKILKEVYALATLVDNPHIVRYFSAWVENKRLFIQTELCEGGSLSEKVGNEIFSEKDLLSLLRQILLGLVQMHDLNLVHLDIKPENIYIKFDYQKKRIYKIGDFGLAASSLSDTETDIEEGDSRYLAEELLNEQNPDLTKADIFAIGATIYELAKGSSLPEKGEEWHDIRNGKLKQIFYSKEFVDLIKKMIHPNPKMRPSARELLTSQIVQKSVTQEELEKQFITLANTLTKQKQVENILREEIEELRNQLKEK